MTITERAQRARRGILSATPEAFQHAAESALRALLLDLRAEVEKMQRAKRGARGRARVAGRGEVAACRQSDTETLTEVLALIAAHLGET